jgi:predicted HTH transcriptional regulator
MDWSNILEFARKGENEKMKFIARVESEDSVGAVLTAMANSKGGEIVIGVDFKNYHLIGADVDINWLKNKVLLYCYPEIPFTPELIHKNEKEILVLKIEAGKSTPYFFKKKCYVRDEKETRLASIEEENELKERQQIKPENTITFLKPSIKTENPSKANTPLAPNFNERQSLILDYLKQNQRITNKEYRSLYEVSHKTAHKELADLVEKGNLIVKGAGRSTTYILNTNTLF